ncbi:DUF4416 family protein [bacterium]|nr:DUF4416 family protein [bacterium]
MGETQRIPKVKPLAGLLAENQELLGQASALLEASFGNIQFASESYLFEHTRYYQKEMGSQLYRQFLVFADLQSAENLVEWKHQANGLEQRLGLNTAQGRRVNIDPGYLAPGKLVLASTKDFEHRVYLRNGIYAEVTLRIRKGCFQTWDWSYPDYAQAADFFDQAYRTYLEEIAG